MTGVWAPKTDDTPRKLDEGSGPGIGRSGAHGGPRGPALEELVDGLDRREFEVIGRENLDRRAESVCPEETVTARSAAS